MAKKKVAKKKKVSFLPKDYPLISPYIRVRNAAKALEFYKSVFGAKVRNKLMMPDKTVGHAELVIGNACVMISEEYPDHGILAPQSVGGTPVAIHIYVPNIDKTFAKARKLRSKVLHEPENQFYGARAGQFLDPYGHQWYVQTHFEEVSPAEQKRRMKELYD